jgi:hypothetical protein
MTNNYGDGVAHVNIARKVIDSPDSSFWQRYIQIGSPWLPLQTILMMPLVANESLWRSGVAGSIVSMLSFVISAVALYWLAREAYGRMNSPLAAILPFVTVCIFFLNPGAVYLQTTPMSEMVFMAALTLSVWRLQRWRDAQTPANLVLAGSAMAVATLSRYEAWPVAALATVLVLICTNGSKRFSNALLFGVIAGCGPIYWMWHNWALYGNALEFLTGPNSARGLYLQNQAKLGWSQLFVGNLFLDLAVMITAVCVCAGPITVLISIIGLATVVVRHRSAAARLAPVWLLGVPFIFHVFGLYRGEIQIFPLSLVGLLNVRYGLPHLLPIALLAPAAACWPRANRRWSCFVLVAVIATQYFILLDEGPAQLAVYQEGFRNGVQSAQARELARAADFLKSHSTKPVVLMHTGALGPLVPRGGLRFSELIHEGTARWHVLDSGIPPDVATIIVKKNDPLDLWIRSSDSLARSLQGDFEKSFETGDIQVFERRKGGK